MRITLKSPAAGHSAGDTANVANAYARWLVEQGYAVEAAQRNDESATSDDESATSEATPARHRKRTAAKVTQSDSDAE